MQLALIAVRVLHFWAVALLFGGAGFALVLGRREAIDVGVVRLAGLLAALSGLAWFAIVFVTVTGDAAALLKTGAWGDFISAPFGWPWLLRLALCGVSVAMAFGGNLAAFAALGGVLVIDQAWLGHAANGAGFEAIVELGFYCLHVLAAFAWVGALAMLCVLTFAEQRLPQRGLATFSRFGLFFVAAIAASGLVNATLRAVGPGDLVSTTYGRILAAKLILFAMMLACAGCNRVWRARGEIRPLLISVGAETLLGLAVIGLAAALGVTAPP